MKSLLRNLLLIVSAIGVAGTTLGQGNLPSKEIVEAKIAKMTQLNSGWRPLDFIRAITGPEQDCSSAIPLCSSSYTETESYTGYGSTQEVSTSTCLSSGETNSVWYMFTVTTAGTFTFSINTLNDYDWALYDITTIGCEGVPTATPVRCNFSGTFGTTGLTLPTSATIPLSNGAGDSPEMAGLDVTVGSTYALIIDNWSADDNGYTITFDGTSSIYDATGPTMTAVASCYTNDVFVTINEDVLCSSILSADFLMTNTTTTTDFTSAITAIDGVGCTGAYTDQLEISHDGTLTSGSYEIEINSGPSLADACGNIISAGSTITFDYCAPITLSASASTICNSGDAVTLTTSGGPSGQTYTLQPGGASNTTGVFNVNPTATTTYSVEVTYGGCTRTANTTVTLEDNVVVTINPVDPTVCSGNATLTASTTIDGVSCGSCTYVWSTTATSTSISAPAGSTYTVNATTPAGCASDNTGSSTVSLASSGAGASCDVLYVSPSGGGDGTTKAAPTTLTAAIAAAICTNTTIKMQTGTYSISDAVDVNSYITLEGGYNSGFTTKTSDLNSGSATRIVRDNTADTDDANSCSAFRVAGSATGFRFQDLRIELPSNHAQDSEMDNYGIYMASGCNNYDIVRCYIDAGTGSDGSTGSATLYSEDFESATLGTLPVSGWTEYVWTGSTNRWTINSSASGGCPITGSNSLMIRRNASNYCDYNLTNDCDKLAESPSFSTVGYTNIQVDFNWVCEGESYYDYGEFWYSDDNGTNWYYLAGPYETQSTTQSVTNLTLPAACNNKANVKIGFDWYNDDSYGTDPPFVVDDIVVTGDGGAGASGGNAYGVYSISGTTGRNVSSCYITGTAGSNGGSTALVYDNGAGDAGYTSVDVDGYPVITMDNISCADSYIQFEAPSDGSPKWSPTGNSAANTVTDFGTGATLPGGNGASVDSSTAAKADLVLYSSGTTGRKDIIFEGDATTSVAAQTFSSSPSAAINDVTCTETVDAITVSGYSTTLNMNNLTVDMDISHTYLGDLEIILIAPNGDVVHLAYGINGGNETCTPTISDAGANSLGVATGPFTGTYTTAQYTGATWQCGEYTSNCTDLGDINSGTYNPNGSWEIRIWDNAGGDVGTLNSWALNFPSGGGGVTNTDHTYEDFVNMIMDRPSPGSVIGTNEICPSTVNFSSSEAGTPGYTYVWSCSDPTGGTSSIASSTSSSTDITFTNSTASAIVFPVVLNITSECCGALDRITYNVTVNPTPSAPIATDATPTNCEGGEDTLSVSTTSGISYSWYNASTGGTLLGTGDEYIVSSTPNGTTSYYVEAVSDKGCVSTSRTQIDLSSTNPAPTTSGASNCAPGTLTVSVTSPVSGATYYWYDASSGGSLLQSGSATTYDVTVASATTVSTWVSVVTETGCDESARTQVDATVTSAPTTTTWTGSTDSDWFKSTNWSDCVPTCEVNAIIPTSTPDCDIDFDNGGIAYAKTLTIDNGGTLKLVDPKTIVELCGDYVQNGTLTASGQGKIVMASTTGAQNWTKGSTGSGNLYKLEINNSNGVNVTNSAGDKSVQFRTDGELILTSGVLTVPSSLRVNMKNTDTTAITGHSSSSYVNGEIRRFVSDANAANSYDFPVGNATSYQLMTINVNQGTLTGGMDKIDVSFADGAVGTGLTIIDANTLFYDGVLDNGGGTAGIWNASPNSGSCTYDVTLNGTVFTNSALNHTVLKRDNSSSAWEWAGSTVGSQSVSGSLVQTNRTGYTSFSEFAIARTNTALPVEFMSFTATLNDDVVELAWETAQEMNSDYFTVMRSPDGVNWEDIMEVDAAGVSNQIVRYFELDVEPLIGKSYYKIKQTDINGEASLSNIAPIVNNPSSMNDVLVYPNPSNGNNFILGIEGFDGEDLLIVLRDINGRELYSKVTMSADHNGVIDIVLDRTLPPGNYLIIAASDHSMVSKKFQVRK